ncbi:MAG: hypothetical protein ACRDUX_38825 [Mycobacterium sp.]
MTTLSRPPWSIDAFVRARREFDDGRGPAEAWARLHEFSLWRVDELAERVGSRTWAMLVAPPDLPPSGRQGECLVHALRSAQLAAAVFPTVWRFEPLGISISRVVVAHEVDAQRAVRLAKRYGQIAVVHMQRIPFEHVVVHDMVGERDVELGRFDPGGIAGHLARVAGAKTAAVVYGWTTIAEGMAMALALWRMDRLTYR